MSEPTFFEGRHLAAILFVDMVGFSLRMQANHDETIAQVNALFELIRQQADAFGGREVDTAGDGMLLEFSGALSAVQCALEVHRELARRNRDQPKDSMAVRARASVHLGELEHRDERIFGDGVNICARLLPIAPPGGIAISPHVRDQLANSLAVTVVSLGKKALKNIREPMEVFCIAGPDCRQKDIADCTGDDLGDAGARKWLVGTAVIDERSMTVTVDDKLVPLERKPLEVLLHLLRHAGEVVTKDEILEAVWPGRVLSDTALNKAISRIRAVLNDEEQNIIVTQRGYGYRLAGHVCVEASDTNPVPQLDLHPGDALAARPNWRLVQQVGSGGHGEVWLARHEKTREERVFKMALEAGHLNSLKREITLSRLLFEAYPDNEQFMRVLDWNLESEPYFIECEYSRNGSLVDWAREQGGLQTVPLSQRLEIAIKIAAALDAAHNVGVLHKDLKPGNVLIHAHPERGLLIRLADFGSGGVVDPKHLDDLNLTRMGFTQAAALGTDQSSATPLYLAPEMLSGQMASVRGDIYALGVILYQLVVGDLRHTLAPGWERNVSDPLLREDIALAASGDPAHRLATAAALAERLRQLEARREALAIAEVERAQALAAQVLKQQNQRMRRILAVVVTFATVSLGLGWTAMQARDAALVARDDAEVIASFLTQDMLKNLNIDHLDMRTLSLQAWLDQVAQQLPRLRERHPIVAMRIYLALADAFDSIGQGGRAIALGNQAISYAQEQWPQQPEVGLSLAQYTGSSLTGAVRREDLPFWDALLAASIHNWGWDDRRTLMFHLHMLYPLSRYRPDFDDEGVARTLLARIRQDYSQDKELLRLALKTLANAINLWSEHAQEVEELLNEYYALKTQEQAQQLSSIVERSQDFSNLAAAQNQTEKAQKILGEALVALRARSHPDAGFLAEIEFNILIKQADQAFAGAIPLDGYIADLEVHLIKSERIFAGADENLTMPSRLLAMAYLLNSQADKAEFHARRLLDISQRHRPEGSGIIQWARLLLASSVRRQGQLTEARTLFDAIKASKAWPELANKDVRYRREEALLLAAEGHTTEARNLLQQVMIAIRAKYGVDHLLTRQTQTEFDALDAAQVSATVGMH